MVQVRNIFGEVLSTPKRTRSTPHQGVLTASEIPEALGSDQIYLMMKKTRNRIFTDAKAEHDLIARRILKIKTDRDNAVRNADRLLTDMPNLSVRQAINFVEYKNIFGIRPEEDFYEQDGHNVSSPH